MRSNRRGANVIEFALLLPFMLMLITGIIDFGYASAVRSAATSAARAGARAGALTPQAFDPNGVALAAATARWASVGLPPTPTIVSFRSDTPEVMVVRVQVDLNSLIGLVLGPSILEITEIRRMEEQP